MRTVIGPATRTTDAHDLPSAPVYP
jgi:hypothetical protein